jgi:tRNA dimethylallyltransferase
MITILGPTATGKTRLAALVAVRLNGEIISADSRQVYRGMDLGTGKDYDDYRVGGQHIACHLVDIVEPGYEYNVFEFQQDFTRVYQDILSRGKTPILCGGTGLYIEAVLKGFSFTGVLLDEELRKKLESKSDTELAALLASLRPLHNVTDISDRARLIRAIEIQWHSRSRPGQEPELSFTQTNVFGIRYERPELRARITERLEKRLKQGMVEEVRKLIESGVSPGKLAYYGLEYRFLTQYVMGEIPFDQMFRLLNTAIHQFAKRQMTWFRRMERNGIPIHWIDGETDIEKKVGIVMNNIV